MPKAGIKSRSRRRVRNLGGGIMTQSAHSLSQRHVRGSNLRRVVGRKIKGLRQNARRAAVKRATGVIYA